MWKSSYWNFDVGESSSYRIQTSVRLHTEQVLHLLQALLGESQVGKLLHFALKLYVITRGKDIRPVQNLVSMIHWS